MLYLFHGKYYYTNSYVLNKIIKIKSLQKQACAQKSNTMDNTSRMKY